MIKIIVIWFFVISLFLIINSKNTTIIESNNEKEICTKNPVIFNKNDFLPSFKKQQFLMKEKTELDGMVLSFLEANDNFGIYWSYQWDYNKYNNEILKILLSDSCFRGKYLINTISEDNLTNPIFFHTLAYLSRSLVNEISTNERLLIIEALENKPLQINNDFYLIDEKNDLLIFSLFMNNVSTLVELKFIDSNLEKNQYIFKYIVNNFLLWKKTYEMALSIFYFSLEDDTKSYFIERKDELLPLLKERLSHENISEFEKLYINIAIDILTS